LIPGHEMIVTHRFQKSRQRRDEVLAPRCLRGIR
jgi:hypothetical protein